MSIQKGMPPLTSVGTDLVIEDLSDDACGYSFTCFCSTAADYVMRTSRAVGES